VPAWRLDTTGTLGTLPTVLALVLATAKDSAGAAITGDPGVALFNPSWVDCR
jgi:hypothetical protein